MIGSSLGGILLLDKPEGWTSNAALGRSRRLLGGVKAGHTGTLDPFATGLLPVTVGEAGKFSRYLLDADKRYVATLKLGEVSTTGDPEGTISRSGAVSALDVLQIEEALKRFLGEQNQTPPMHSALKQNGTPLYKLARQGIEVSREPRRIIIHELTLLAWDGKDTLSVEVLCSKGTYIRVLAEDIGRMLGCGAYLTGLRRTAVGPFRIDEAVDLKTLEEMEPDSRHACLVHPGLLLCGLPRVDLTAKAARELLNGKHPRIVSDLEGEVQAWGPSEVLLGVANAVRTPDGIQLVPQRLMSPGVLP